MPFIHHIETLVPETFYSQEYAHEVMKTWASQPKSLRYLDKVYAHSGIGKRHSVIEDFGEEGADSLSFYRAGPDAREPSTGERNAIYSRESRHLIEKVTARTFENCRSISRDEVTHVITVSCTGFYNPGPDLVVVNSLGLRPSVQRFHLGFMGCYAAFPALKMADQFCRADENAKVLIVCVELCSLHLQMKEELDTLLANSVFADGAASVLVSASAPPPGMKGLDLTSFSSSLAREGEVDMAWDIGDNGFNIVLSKYVAKILGAGIQGIVSDVLSHSGLGPEDIDTWAVHPGGRSILDKIEASLNLRPDQMQASRETLFEFGNMSSPTILFILARLLNSPKTSPEESICAMAFGPGLTIETAILHAVVS